MTTVTVTEEVFHSFTLDQLPDALRKRVEANDATDDSLQEALAEWFTDLSQPYATANYAEVSERSISINRK